MKLTQRHLFKGSQEFEIIDEYVKVCVKTPLTSEETSTVMLAVINPEPIIGHSSLEFVSRVNGKPLLSLRLGRPNTEEFNAFVGALKSRAAAEFQAFAGLKRSSPPSALSANVFGAPPEFEDAGRVQTLTTGKDIDPVRIEESVRMLKTYLSVDDIAPFLAALEKLASDTQNESLQIAVTIAFANLGSSQGAVLTYAPYVAILMSDAVADSPA